MEKILSIDLTSKPIKAILLSIEGDKIEVQSEHTAEIDNFLDYCPDESIESEIKDDEIKEEKTLEFIKEQIKNLISNFDAWDTSIITIPGNEYLSLNLDLPFDNEKFIKKVLKIQIEDKIPFDLNDFAVSYKKLNSTIEEGSDIHVSLVPKKYIEFILEICRDILEPEIITTPTSSLSAISLLSKTDFEENAAYVLAKEGFSYIGIKINNEICMDRINRFSKQSANSNDSDNFISNLKLSIKSAEIRYQAKITDIYLLGDSIEASLIKSNFTQEVNKLEISDLISKEDNQIDVAEISGVLARNGNDEKVLSNFRSGEFAYHKRTKELIHEIKKLSPYFISFVALFLLVKIVGYFLNNNEISRINNSIQNEFSLLNLNSDESVNSVDDLKSKISILGEQLNTLGTPSKFNPLDSFLEISNDLADASASRVDFEIRKLKITSDKIKIEGTSPSYAAVEKIKRILKKRQNIYCSIKSNTAGGSKARNFSFDLELCKR